MDTTETYTPQQVLAAARALTKINDDPDAGLTRRKQRMQGRHTLATAAKIYGTTARNTLGNFERMDAGPMRAGQLARYYVAVNREDLAEPLLPLLTEWDMAVVDVCRRILHRDGPALRVLQHNGAHAVRRDRGVSRPVGSRG